MKISISIHIWPYFMASIVFAIIINTVGWNHPDIWCFNWIDHNLYNWFWVVFNALISVPVCCSFLVALVVGIPYFIIGYIFIKGIQNKRRDLW